MREISLIRVEADPLSIILLMIDDESSGEHKSLPEAALLARPVRQTDRIAKRFLQVHTRRRQTGSARKSSTQCRQRTLELPAEMPRAYCELS